jgi:hypothetical protein
MATTSEARALPFFTDLYGDPLQSGSVYIGQAGLDPVAYPAVVTSDVAGLVVLQQPVRTVHGHATAAGALVHMFCPIPYSITILDAAGRLVYASLNETDPIFTSLNTSSVQSAGSIAELQSRSGAATNQVWVKDFGMFVADQSDQTTPQAVPSVVVGNDGTRYKLGLQFVNAQWVHASAAATAGTQGDATPGAWMSWNDDAAGTAFLTCNKGTGAGGIQLRIVSADGSVVLGKVNVSAVGGITADSDIRSVGDLIAQNGRAFLSTDESKGLTYDGTNYNLIGGPQLNINGQQAATDANLAAKMSPRMATIFQTKAVGGLTLTTGAAPGDPGTWSAIVTGVGSTGVSMWVRTA